MRKAAFLISVIAVSWTSATVDGQTTPYGEIGSAAASQTLFQTSLAPAAAYGAFRRDELMRFAPVGSLLASDWADPQQSKPKPQPQPEPVQRPPIDPSMVGYIDEAIIQSEIRVRFDAAERDDTPDRAEYFYAKCGCYRGLPPTNPAYDPTAPGPGPGIPQYVNFQQLYIFGEFALSHRYSLFGQLPFRWLQAQGTSQAFPSSGGIGDIQVGAKFAPFASETHFLTFQFASNLPSGDPAKGLGTNHATIEPMVLYYQSLGSRASIEGQFGDTHPLSSSKGVPGVSGGGGFAGDVLTYGVGGSYQFVQHESTRVAGVLELVGWNGQGGMVTPPASTDGVNIVNLKIGSRISFAAHHSIYVGYGVALTSNTWYHEIFRTEYRYAF
jgi:hypothetical protein